MATPEHLDAIIIGTGQGGKPLAGALAEAGWRAAIIERDRVGGDVDLHRPIEQARAGGAAQRQVHRHACVGGQHEPRAVAELRLGDGGAPPPGGVHAQVSSVATNPALSGEVWVANRGNDSVSVIDTGAGRAVAELEVSNIVVLGHGLCGGVAAAFAAHGFVQLGKRWLQSGKPGEGGQADESEPGAPPATGPAAAESRSSETSPRDPGQGAES